MELSMMDIGLIAMSLYAIAQVIARATKTKRDDQIVSRVGKLLNIVFSKSREK